MKAVAVHQVPRLAQERYEEVICRLTNGKRRLESPSERRLSQSTNTGRLEPAAL